MSKKGRVQQAKLDVMEQEFQILLPKCLIECAKGRWGLFGQNSIADPEDRYWTWPEAKHLRELASDIHLVHSTAGSVDPLVERFLELCGAGKANAVGEPKLALALFAEMQAPVASPNRNLVEVCAMVNGPSDGLDFSRDPSPGRDIELA